MFIKLWQFCIKPSKINTYKRFLWDYKKFKLSN